LPNISLQTNVRKSIKFQKFKNDWILKQNLLQLSGLLISRPS
jgi:hypothetical protein